MWQGWGFLGNSNTGNRISSKREETNGINQVQQTFTSEHQMLRLGSGSKFEGSNESLLQCSEVSFKKEYIYLGRKAHKNTSYNLKQRGIWEYVIPMRPELFLNHSFRNKVFFSRRNDLSKLKPDAKLPAFPNITCCCRSYPSSLSCKSEALTEPYRRKARLTLPRKKTSHWFFSFLKQNHIFPS